MIYHFITEFVSDDTFSLRMNIGAKIFQSKQSGANREVESMYTYIFDWLQIVEWRDDVTIAM